MKSQTRKKRGIDPEVRHSIIPANCVVNRDVHLTENMLILAAGLESHTLWLVKEIPPEGPRGLISAVLGALTCHSVVSRFPNGRNIVSDGLLSRVNRQRC